MRENNIRALPLYESHPPDWLPKAHASADLGYTGFHPPRPGQDEDVLSTANVKNGFTVPAAVAVERFSAQRVVNESLRTGDSLHQLEELMNAVFIRRADRISPVPPSTFRMPTRVTLNDSKRQSWLADLANPDVPLYKLGKSVPHGAKGHDLLDLLQSNKVAIPRAVWLLRVLGANETAGLRNKPSYNPIQYSVDWANVVAGYMKKQLTDIALPSAPRPGLNIKQTFKGVLADADTRERWISRFSYCLELLRPFYSEGLVDSRTFLVWLVQQMGSSNLAQVGFVVRLADGYLDGIMGNRALARPFIDACLCKLSEIRTSATQEFLVGTEALLKLLLQRVCLSLSDAFVSPGMWSTHATLLSDALTENIMEHSSDPHIEQNSREVHQLLLDNFIDIKRRNEAMLFTNLPSHVSAKLRTVVSDVQFLNSISDKTDIGSVTFFSADLQDDSQVFIDKLQMLLTWSVTPLQFGDHRPFAAVTLIRNWRDRVGDRATRRDFAGPDEFLQDQLFDWLDISDPAGDGQNLRAVAILFGKLVKEDLFSFARYIQRLVARGETGLSYSEANGSRHRDFLRWIPLYNSTSSLTSQRKVTLHGARARETPEDSHERDIRKEIRALLPELFNGVESPPLLISMSDLLAKCSNLVSASRFEQVRTFRQWLLPLLQKRIASLAQDHNRMSQPSLLTWYSICTELMVTTKCFHTALELILCALQHSTTVDLLNAVIDTLQRFTCIWTCMNITGTIVNALYSAHQHWKKIRGGEFRALLNLLVEFDDGRYLDDISRSHLNTDISSFTLALRPYSDRPDPVPDVLPEILLLAGDPDADAPSMLASGLWIKYRMSLDWAWKVWDNTVASLRQIPVMTSDAADRKICALRYGTFLWHVDQHIPKGLDEEVLQWFLGPGKNEVAALSADAWDVLTVVLLHLSVHGALQTTTILQGLVYPAWQLGASASTAQQGQSRVVLLRAVNALFQHLLLREDEDGGFDNIPPTGLLELQCIRTRRQAVYREPHFLLLVSSIPLLVSLESNENLPQDIRDDLASLRHTLSRHDDFRHGAFRNLDAIRETFEYCLQAEEADENRDKSMVAALRVLLSDASDDDDVELSSWPDVTSLLSPWKLAATSIELQFILRQMGLALSREVTHAAAQANLDKLILMIFHHSMTSEEAYFVAQMARGTEGAVAGKFINNGLKCVTEILRDLTMSAKSLTAGFERTGELLRVIAYVAEPLRGAGSQLPTLDPGIQDEFFEVLNDKFVNVEHSLAIRDLDPSLGSELTQAAISLARLLQFHLGFPVVWTSKIKELSISLSSTILRLVLLHGSGMRLDLGAYPLLIDTLYYLLDELTLNVKTPTFDPFCYSPQILPSDIPSDFPREYRAQLEALLPNFPPTAIVSQLATFHRDTTGQLVYDAPVLNRPWEWIENLGEPALLDHKDEEKEKEEKERLGVQYLVKNSGSLSLDVFGARMTGDGILQAQEGDAKIQANLRTFQDGLSAEGIFKRDWRETRMEPEIAALVDASMGRVRNETQQLGAAGAMHSIQGRPEKRWITRASPASSILSRSSAHGSTASRRPSPGQSSLNRLSNSTTADGDSSTTASSSSKVRSKRKAPTNDDDDDDDDDDDVVIVESSTRSKRPKLRAVSTKTRAKKR